MKERNHLLARSRHVVRARMALVKAIPTSDGDLGDHQDAGLYTAESLLYDWLANLPEDVRKELVRTFGEEVIP